MVQYVRKSQKVFKHLDNLGVNTTGQSKAKVEVNQGDLEDLKKAAAELKALKEKYPLENPEHEENSK